MKDLDFQKQFPEYRQKIFEIIKNYLPNKEPRDYYQIVREYPLRQGKYLRPALVLLASHLFSENLDKSFLTAATIQIAEDWLLIHDDFFDGSLKRRGELSLNKKYGAELAVNAGDSLHLIMDKMLLDNIKILGCDLGFKIFEKINRILLLTLEGQSLELSWRQNGKINISEKEYYEMIYKKTVVYSFLGPLQLGAILAGANNKDRNLLKTWAVFYGYAFQIMNDLKNIENDGSDIIEGKRNLILINLLKKCNQKEEKIIFSIYQKNIKEKTETDKNEVKELIAKYKILKIIKNIVERFIEQATNNYFINLKSYNSRVINQRSGPEFIIDIINNK